MDRPYIILHMLVSLDGKITGDYLESNLGTALAEEYYRINREYDADAFACGRITMEGSFTKGVKPDLQKFENKPALPHSDYVAKKSGFYAVSIDPHGRLGWYGSEIIDEDEGYGNAHIIEVLTEDIDDAYLWFLRDLGISYVFCGKKQIDTQLVLKKLRDLFDIKKLLLEGGGLTDTLFLQTDSIDEISMVVAPMVDSSTDGIDLFAKKQGSTLARYKLKKVQKLPNDGLWLNYVK